MYLVMGHHLTLRIKNWERFQHYKNRKPPWIRLYADLLDDPEFEDLDAELQKTLIKLWLAASQHDTDGSLPDIKRLALRVHVASTLLAKHISQLSHWVIDDCKQDASNMLASETEDRDQSTEGESDSKTAHARDPKPKRKTKTILPDDWEPNASHGVIAREQGVDLRVQTELFRDHWKGNGERKADWDATFRNWLRRAKDFSRAGPQKFVPAQSTMDFLKERMGRDEE